MLDAADLLVAEDVGVVHSELDGARARSAVEIAALVPHRTLRVGNALRVGQGQGK